MNRSYSVSIFIALMLMSGCKTMNTQTVNLSGSMSIDAADCHADRKVVKEMTAEHAVVQVINNAPHLYIEATSTRLIPCNCPEGLKDGQKVMFSAQVKEIFPHERRSGTPCVLSQISEASAQ